MQLRPVNSVNILLIVTMLQLFCSDYELRAYLNFQVCVLKAAVKQCCVIAMWC